MKVLGDKENLLLSHQVRTGPPGSLNSFAERSPGMAGSRICLRPQWFISKGYV